MDDNRKPWEKPSKRQDGTDKIPEKGTKHPEPLGQDVEVDEEQIKAVFKDIVEERVPITGPKVNEFELKFPLGTRFVLPPYTFYRKVGNVEQLITFASIEELEAHTKGLRLP